MELETVLQAVDRFLDSKAAKVATAVAFPVCIIAMMILGE